MKFPFFKTKLTLIKTLIGKDKEIIELKAELSIAKFKLENQNIFTKYKLKHITPDIVVKDICVDVCLVDIEKEPISFMFLSVFKKPPHTEPKFVFLCEDLKTELAFELSLKEVEELSLEHGFANL